MPNAAGGIMTDNYTFFAANEVINKNSGNWVWNNPAYHRSYWACSPAYFAAKYPEVASDVDPAVLHQKYYTYAELENGAGFDADNKTPSISKRQQWVARLLIQRTRRLLWLQLSS